MKIKLKHDGLIAQNIQSFDMYSGPLPDNICDLFWMSVFHLARNLFLIALGVFTGFLILFMLVAPAIAISDGFTNSIFMGFVYWWGFWIVLAVVLGVVTISQEHLENKGSSLPEILLVPYQFAKSKAGGFCALVEWK